MSELAKSNWFGLAGWLSFLFFLIAGKWETDTWQFNLCIMPLVIWWTILLSTDEEV